LGSATAVTEVLAPHEAELGLSRDGPVPPGEERLAALTQALAENRDVLADAAVDLAVASHLASSVNAERLPESVGGTPVRQRVVEAQDALARVAEGAAWLPLLPDLLGADGPKRYLLLFQNDKEIRATGGFLSAYAHLELDGGRFSLSESADIYSLTLPNHHTPAPSYFRSLLPAGGLYLYFASAGLPVQDTNVWPDVPASLSIFETHYLQAGLPPYDGVILVDTRLVEEVLRFTGPIPVEGYAEPFSAEPVDYLGYQIPQAVFQLELYAQRLFEEEATRKEVLGDLADALTDHLMGLPASRWPDLAGLLHDQARQRHLLLLFQYNRAQALADRLDLSGSLERYDGDFLAVVDANYGINKGDLFVARHVDQAVHATPEGGIRREVTVTYENRGPADRWLNGDPFYLVRFYVPQGAELVSLEGGVLPPVTSAESGYTVFATVASVPPGATTTVRVAYTLPPILAARLRHEGEYRLLIRRQPGLDAVPHTLDLFGATQALALRYDTEVRHPLPAQP
ncbi:MAG TPA: DUF4012 domain-containing protein, partial [Dehalococcoidia bacterium]